MQWYAAAIHHFPNFWKDNEKITNFFHNKGNRDNYITTCLARVASMADTFFLWQMQIISPGSLDMRAPTDSSNFSLDNDRQAIQTHVLVAVYKHGECYSTMNYTEPFKSGSDSDSGEETEDSNVTPQCHNILTSSNVNIIWTKPVLVTGTAGCGKSYTIYSIVNRLIRDDTKILIAAPTGFLASVFRSNVPDEVDCETVHASFRFPVEDDVSATINWQLSKYDLIIIDEISMIPDIIFKHIQKTLMVLLFHPVIMVCGDGGQQQPFSRSNGKVMQLTSPFDGTTFINNTYH